MYAVEFRKRVYDIDSYGYPKSTYEWSEWMFIMNNATEEGAKDSVRVFSEINKDRQYRYREGEGRHT